MYSLLSRLLRSAVAGVLLLLATMFVVTSCDTTGKACSSDAICAKGQICLENKCSVGCRTNFDCTEGQFCLDNKCGKQACKPGAAQECYDGPVGTKYVGLCRPGRQFCNTEGLWGACSGQLLPQAETCDREDNDCNGKIDDGPDCECNTPGAQRECYSGPLATAKTAPCMAGVQACLSDNRWGKCRDQRLPLPESCDGIDNDCDGKIDNSLTCGCKDGEQRACYNGPPNTQGSGICKGGTQSCQSGQWSSCQGEVTPTSEICNGKDNDCNGQIDDLSSGQSCNGEPTLEPPPEPRTEVAPDASLPEELPVPDSPDVPDILPVDLPVTPDTGADKYKYVVEKVFSAGLGGELVPRDVAVDGNGNVYVVGSFKGTVTIGTITLNSKGGDDVFVAGFDAMGNPFLTISGGSSGRDVGLGIAIGANGVLYITGECSGGECAFGSQSKSGIQGSRMFLLRLVPNSSGVPVPAALIVAGGSFGGLSKGIDIAAVDGKVYVLGQYDQQLQFGIATKTAAVTSEVFLAEFSSTLAISNLWSTSSMGSQPGGLAMEVVAGSPVAYFTGQITSAATTTFEGETLPTPAGGSSAFVIKFEMSKPIELAIKSMIMPCQTSCFGKSIAVDQTSIYLGGTFAGVLQRPPPGASASSGGGRQDMFVARMDRATLTLNKVEATLSTPGIIDGVALAADGLGGLFVVGTTTGKTAFGVGLNTKMPGTSGLADAFFFLLDANWLIDWDAQTGASPKDPTNGKESGAWARGVTTNRAGDAWIIGSFSGSMQFAGGLKTAIGTQDMFLLKVEKAKP